MDEIIEKYKAKIESLQIDKATKPNRLSPLLMNEFDSMIESITVFIQILEQNGGKGMLKLYHYIYNEMLELFDDRSKEFYEEYGKGSAIEIIAAVQDFNNLFSEIIDDLTWLDPIQLLSIIRKEQYN